MLMTFDSPDSNVCTVRRERSNTPLQALTLLNDTVFIECAQAFGRRLIVDRPRAEPAERIAYAYRLALSRDPTAGELRVLQDLYNKLREASKAQPEAAAQLVGTFKVAGVEVTEAAAWVALSRAVLNLDEFVMRE
jgi:hypothetical protein